MIRTRTWRTAAAGVAASLALVLLPTGAASAATAPIPGSYFGMSDGDPLSWPTEGVGSIRLWDTHVTWRDLETKPGVFDFTRLDQQVAVARSHGARPLLTLGMTPKFHALKPGAPGLYGAGTTSMPSLASWRTYVKKVVLRYRGQMDYQIWNEANVSGFWTGSQAQLATLTMAASKIINYYDGRAQVVGPAMGTRLSGQRLWMRQFYGQRVGGRTVAGWTDVVALHLYPLPTQGPEASMAQLSSAKIWLSRLGVHKPIWNTEINYGIRVGGGGSARDISQAREAAMVARTYVLNASAGVRRVYWYAWDLHSFVNTQLTLRNGVTLSPAGRAYGVVRSWLLGSRLSSCTQDSKGTYTCTARYSDGVRRIYWNPSRTVYISTPATTTNWVNLNGTSTTIGWHKPLKVDYSPKMVRSKK